MAIQFIELFSISKSLFPIFYSNTQIWFEIPIITLAHIRNSTVNIPTITIKCLKLWGN